MLSARRLVELQDIAAEVYVDPTIMEYAATLVLATRRPAEYGLPDMAAYLGCGASPRATLGLIAAARALALIHGRGYALAEDVHHLAEPVLRHRLVLTYQALAEGSRRPTSCRPHSHGARSRATPRR